MKERIDVEAIIARREAGETLQAIAVTFNVTRQRVHQVLVRYAPGLSARVTLAQREKKQQARARAKREKEDCQWKTFRPPRPVSNQGWHPLVDEALCIRALVAAKTELGATYIALPDYEKWRLAGASNSWCPPGHMIAQKFGWVKTSAKAGLVYTGPKRLQPSTVSDERRLQAMVRYLRWCRKNKTAPGQNHYASWAGVHKGIGRSTMNRYKQFNHWLEEAKKIIEAGDDSV